MLVLRITQTLNNIFFTLTTFRGNVLFKTSKKLIKGVEINKRRNIYILEMYTRSFVRKLKRKFKKRKLMIKASAPLRHYRSFRGCLRILKKFGQFKLCSVYLLHHRGFNGLRRRKLRRK